MKKRSATSFVALCAASAVIGGAQVARADVRINEIFFDSPGQDYNNEYIELSGTPNQSLNNHYLVVLENELATGGSIDNIFNLSTQSLGTNGHLLLRMKNAAHTGIRPGTTDLINTGSGAGYGDGAGSTIGHSNANADGQLENGGFSAFLIKVENGAAAPQLNEDLDVGNDGLDAAPNYADANPDYLKADWRIIDSIGQLETSENAGTSRAYSKITFSATNLPATSMEAGATNVNTGLETEYLARWGNSTGSEPTDWLMANLTDNSLSGFTAANRWNTGYRISGQHGISDIGEAWVGPHGDAMQYGMVVQNTLGAINKGVAGDANFDGNVDTVDFGILAANFGTTNLRFAQGNFNFDIAVDTVDFNLLAANFGFISGGESLGATVPEPGAIAVAGLGATVALMRSGRKRKRN